MNFLRENFLNGYYHHFKKYSNSLLCKILFIGKINDTHFMIMKSVLYTNNISNNKQYTLHKLYDLKGSKHKRIATRWQLLLNDDDEQKINKVTIKPIDENTNTANDTNTNINDDENDSKVGGHLYSPSYVFILNEIECSMDKCTFMSFIFTILLYYIRLL